MTIACRVDGIGKCDDDDAHPIHRDGPEKVTTTKSRHVRRLTLLSTSATFIDRVQAESLQREQQLDGQSRDTSASSCPQGS